MEDMIMKNFLLILVTTLRPQKKYFDHRTIILENLGTQKNFPSVWTSFSEKWVFFDSLIFKVK